MHDLDPVSRELVRVRTRFAPREAYAMSVALAIALLTLPTLLSPLTPRSEPTVLLLQILLVAPVLYACRHVYRRRDVARPLLLYAFALHAAITLFATQLPGAYAFIGVQALLIAALWLPPIGAVFRDAYGEDVIGAAPLAARGRRGAWTLALTLAWLIASFAAAVLATVLAR